MMKNKMQINPEVSIKIEEEESMDERSTSKINKPVNMRTLSHKESE